MIAVSKRWVTATAAAMAVLRATALGDCGVSSSIKMAMVTVEAKTTVAAATALVTISLVGPTITLFVTCNIVANAIARVVAIAITFVSVQQRG